MAETERKRLTPTHRKMLRILQDGKPHRKEELHGCLYDDMGGVENVRKQVSGLREHVRALGMDILCVLVNVHARRYQLVSTSLPDITSLLSPVDNGTDSVQH